MIPKLGTGKRFKTLEHKLAHQLGIKNSAAVAATIGREKYGKSKFQKLAAKSKKAS